MYSNTQKDFALNPPPQAAAYSSFGVNTQTTSQLTAGGVLSSDAYSSFGDKYGYPQQQGLPSYTYSPSGTRQNQNDTPPRAGPEPMPTNPQYGGLPNQATGFESAARYFMRVRSTQGVKVSSCVFGVAMLGWFIFWIVSNKWESFHSLGMLKYVIIVIPLICAIGFAIYWYISKMGNRNQNQTVPV
ncbi:hypothetical protein HOLleu_18437 [Holothuria leucospilota]|uniref:Uncharacterized protein n=1 Tax=Holothuria leucospilota TaxID=206669 RepID=A0A9Q1H9N2_HOLLE|nr:hypothetical protein HOLleu_18437 [Holothuria leucospilota]